MASARRLPIECAKLKTLSIGSLLAEAIKRIHNEDSVSSLFEM